MSDDKITYKSYALNIVGDETKAEWDDSDNPCEYCGGWPDGMEEKSVRQRRQLRYLGLNAKLQVAKLQGKTHKIWKTEGGSRVRPSHQAANNKSVPIDDYFKIGQEKLFLPSDPNASFSETANCRCDVTFTGSKTHRPIVNTVNNLTISKIAYGEFRSHAWLRSGATPNGLADAIASAGAACQRGNPCHSVDGSNSKDEDLIAWNTIRNAIGGVDQSGGGDLMCVGNQGCVYVHSAFTWINGARTLVKRPTPLSPTGIVTISGAQNGSLTLYFYKLPYKGWLTARDLLGPPQTP